jgi:hypothetical protein
MVVFDNLLIGDTRASHQFLEVKHGEWRPLPRPRCRNHPRAGSVAFQYRSPGRTPHGGPVVTSRVHPLLNVSDGHLTTRRRAPGPAARPAQRTQFPRGTTAPRQWPAELPAGSCDALGPDQPHPAEALEQQPRLVDLRSTSNQRAGLRDNSHAWGGVAPSHHPIDATRPAGTTIPVSEPVERPVPGSGLGSNAHDMDAFMIPDASANPAVFLVELRATHASSLETAGMHMAVTPARRHWRDRPVAERTDHPRAVPKSVLHCRRGPSRRRRAHTARPPRHATGTRRDPLSQRGGVP